MSLLYKQVLVVGATSGIGHAMASRLIKEGSKVIAVGRRQDRLDAFVQEYGEHKAASARLDIGDLGSIPGFVEEYGCTTQIVELDAEFKSLESHPDTQKSTAFFSTPAFNTLSSSASPRRSTAPSSKRRCGSITSASSIYRSSSFPSWKVSQRSRQSSSKPAHSVISKLILITTAPAPTSR